MNRKTSLAGRSPGGELKGAAIRIGKLSKIFGTVAAVDSVDLDVNAGEFLSLLGPSGSGKTTLLMMIAGFETASSGAIVMDGRDLTSVPPNKRGIGMVFQRYALFPHMSVADNVAFPLRMRGVPRAEIGTRVERALEMVRLADYGSRLPAQLSGGQQQRVAVARALIFEPPVLLMDEPLGALDKKLREELQIEIKKLHDEVGVTIIYVTHDQEEALIMSDRIAVMNRGMIEQLGTPRKLYDSPASPFVADFIGKMNFIPGELSLGPCGEPQFSIGDRTLKISGATVVGAVADGASARLAVRPERLALTSLDDPEALRGVVDTVVFVGASTMCLVQLDGGASIQAQAPPSARLMAGERIGLRVAPASSVIFASESRF